MSWYDWFASVYDRSLEPSYRDARTAAADALRVAHHHSVLDLPCGTGQSFNTLAPQCRALIGVDLSAGMLRMARRRADKHAWTHVHLLQRDVHALGPADLAATGGQVDRLQIFLGLSVFPEFDAAFTNLWSLLAPGGRCVVVDVHSERLSLQGRMVNLLAGADIRRRTWEPLSRVAAGFTLTDLPRRREHGGQIFLATGVKPTA